MPQPCQRSSRPSLPKPPAGVVTVHRAPQGSAVISCCTRSIVRRPLGSCRRQYLPPVLVEVKLPNVSGTGQRVEKHLTCRVVSRRRDLYEVGVRHVLLRSNLPADRALYRERGTLPLPLLPRSGSMNPASLARRAL